MKKEKKSIEEVPVLKVFSPQIWHDSGYVVGNRAGLEALRDAVDEALKNGAGSGEVFETDGEGYYVMAALFNNPIHSDAWNKYPVHYVSDVASENVITTEKFDNLYELFRKEEERRRYG